MYEGLQWSPSMGQPVIRSPAAGRVFFVRSTGDNDNNGVDPGTPLQTITYALTQCAAGRGDYIIVMDNTSANEPAWPIVVDVTIVHIIGRWGAPYAEPSIRAVGAGNACFQLEAPWIEIAGLELGAGDDATPIIQSPAGPGTIGEWWIHHCTFGWIIAQSFGSDGIWVQNTHDAPQCVIEHCWFRGPQAATGGCTRDGIRIEGNATRSIFRNNLFWRLTGGIGIHCIQNGSDIGAILDNGFFAPIADALAAGWAITMESGVGNALIAGNKASQTGDATGTNPYRDLSTGALATCLNGWVDNHAGNALSAGPAIV
jgi:hypothetical protein